MYYIFDYLVLTVGFLFTFLVPGFLITETFLGIFPKIFKVPFYLVISIISSTLLIFALSLIFGFSKITIWISFLFFGLWLVYFLAKKPPRDLFIFPKKHLWGLALALLVFLLFVGALGQAVFRKSNGFYIMAADNWQDTAMHLSIIQSIAQGNFPPQTPYFSGRELNYYYFTDFHTAILQTLTNQFLPRILVLDNSLLAFTFTLGMYALGYLITGRRSAALIIAFLGIFNSNFMFVKFVKDVLVLIGKGNLPALITNLLASQTYAFEYLKLIQLTPTVNYFLQNRPMIVGLPALVAVLVLFFAGSKMRKNESFIIAGIIAGSLIKFQIFAWLTALFLTPVYFLLVFVKSNRREASKHLLLFILSFVTISLGLFVVSSDRQGMVNVLSGSLSFGVWDKSRSLGWFLLFPFANFGPAFILLPVIFFLASIKKIFLAMNIKFFFLACFLLAAVPYFVRFTVFDYDMFKFFCLMMIPLAVVAGWFLDKIGNFPLGKSLIVIFLVFSALTSFLDLAASFLNQNVGYSEADYQVGLWVRESTPPRSVFVTLDTVHCPVTDIAGRLRILSYSNWPLSHGFGSGADNIHSRWRDMEILYTTDNSLVLANLLVKYNVSYIYYGQDERNKFPQAGARFESCGLFKTVYNQNQIEIFKVI